MSCSQLFLNCSWVVLGEQLSFCGLFSIALKIKHSNITFHYIAKDVVATGAVNVQELSKEDWEQLPSWFILKPLERDGVSCFLCGRSGDEVWLRISTAGVLHASSVSSVMSTLVEQQIPTVFLLWLSGLGLSIAISTQASS